MALLVDLEVAVTAAVVVAGQDSAAAAEKAPATEEVVEAAPKATAAGMQAEVGWRETAVETVVALWEEVAEAAVETRSIACSRCIV